MLDVGWFTRLSLYSAVFERSLNMGLDERSSSNEATSSIGLMLAYNRRATHLLAFCYKLSMCKRCDVGIKNTKLTFGMIIVEYE
jgi:hypothetical protein